MVIKSKTKIVSFFHSEVENYLTDDIEENSGLHWSRDVVVHCLTTQNRLDIRPGQIGDLHHVLHTVAMPVMFEPVIGI